MSTGGDGVSLRAAEWVYNGLWGVLTGFFDVPRDPPELPTHPGEEVVQRKPSLEWLRYRKMWFWIACIAIDVGLAALWLLIYIGGSEAVALALLMPWLFVMIVPDVIAYVAIHLRYDTTWYVLSPRSVRIRRGIWLIHETTITYENVQDVRIHQGPIQRWFGFANLTIQTAGGGGSAGQGGSPLAAHVGLIEGVHDAEELRDRIMTRVRASRSAGLGDDREEHESGVGASGGLTAAHVEVLREIAAAAKQLSA